MVRETLVELARVVQPSGYVAFEVAEVRNGKVLLERLVWDAADGLPFDRLFVMVKSASSPKPQTAGRSKQLKGDQHQ